MNLSKFPALIVLLLPLSFMTAACGGYHDVEVKEYRIGVTNPEPEFKELFAQLIADYNEQLGFQGLTYADNLDVANSTITVTKGLEARDGKVGWGQWVRESDAESPMVHVTGRTPERVIRYSMNLEFDYDYVIEHRNIQDPKHLYEQMKLFCHEVGHGLLEEHRPDPRDVMYKNIAGEKDFVSYFQRVRQFF